MKYVGLRSERLKRPACITVLVGVHRGSSFLVARKRAGDRWAVYQNREPGSLRKESLEKIADLPSMDAVLEEFSSRSLKPYCPKAELIRAESPGKEGADAEARPRDKRRYFRKRVSLNGTYRNQRTEELGDALVEDVSFNGIRFVTLGSSDIEVGDTLWVSFTLDNAKRSLIKREARVKHVQEGRIGAEFLNAPEYDKELGFHLWVCHG